MGVLSLWALPLLALLLATIWTGWRNATLKPVPHQSSQSHKELPSDYDSIQPLNNFVLAEAEPLQIRPWKPKYNLTMGLENAEFSDFLPLNKTLVTRLALRRRIIAEHRDMVTSSDPSSANAVREFYTWLVAVYLPRRYPDAYTCRDDTLFGPASTALPLKPPNNVNDVLRLLAENVDSEFVFLKRQNGYYIARALIMCYPFTFNPSHKLNKTVAQIHGPVPGYKSKLEKSMARYFASLPKGKLVKRHNWNIALEKELFRPGINPFIILPLSLMDKIRDVLFWLGIGFPKMKVSEVDGDEITLRCERQTLHRLMENDDTLVFAFQTYQYPLRQIREEGGASALIEAIRGLKSSVPQMEWYKASIYWSDAVIQYLLGDSMMKEQ